MKPTVFRTEKGTAYLQEPGVALIGYPVFTETAYDEFLSDFSDLGFPQYSGDDWQLLSPGAALVKASGQCCYASFGPKRTKNSDAGAYLEHILDSRHGSVLEHANYSLFLWGISRSLTHELVRHRAGTAFSQLSQRYVGSNVLRFVERPEVSRNPEKHEEFLRQIDAHAEAYRSDSEYWTREIAVSHPGLPRTEHRKKAQQIARRVLPNQTETWITMTANLRAWRNILEQRGSEVAEIEMRVLSLKILQALKKVVPELFRDARVSEGKDGYPVIKFAYSKV